MFEKIKQFFRTTVSNDAQDYYEVGFEFNSHWVSLDYPENRGENCKYNPKFNAERADCPKMVEYPIPWRGSCQSLYSNK